MPGVLAAEPFRSVPARISRGHRDKRVAITGRLVTPSLSRVLDPDLRPMPMPEAGLLLSEALAEAIGARRGDMVTVELLTGRRQVVQLPVSGISLGYVGLGAAMEIGALNRLMGEGAVISGAALQIDPAARAAFHAAAKRAPQTAFVSLTDANLARFQDTLAENIRIMVTVYTILAAIIAVGVVYNFARISLSEQGRELASLRVLGFTEGEVSRLLWAELAVVVLAAQPLGWAVGYAIAWAMTQAFSSDLYRVPLVVGREVHATASLAVIAAAAASGALMAGRIRNLDLIAVLKTRE
jgi:putative ABC transport system permease protein